MINRLFATILGAVLLAACQHPPSRASAPAGLLASMDEQAFHQADSRDWEVALSDPGTGDWTENWFLDGEIASVRNTPEGMQLTAGPRPEVDEHHMVLWTKESFEGDIKIEYEYTRLDFETAAVNIIYIGATGSGDGPYSRDITEWSHLRTTPAMRTYFNHMNTYHVSYAAFGGERGDYVRARRYMPEASGLEGTGLSPDYWETGMFQPGVPHRFTIIKHAREIFLRIENDDQTRYMHWKNEDLPPILEGRIGLRHMWTRSARYHDFRVSIPVE